MVVIVDVECGVELEWLEYGRVKGGVEKNGVGVWFDVGEKDEWNGTVESGVGSIIINEYIEVVVVGWLIWVGGDNRISFG